MAAYKTKVAKLPGSNYGELRNEALYLFSKIKRQTKRRPYIRSVYFGKQKIFFDYFWPHLFQKPPKERMQRLRYFAAAIELIRYSRDDPLTKTNPNKTRGNTSSLCWHDQRGR